MMLMLVVYLLTVFLNSVLLSKGHYPEPSRWNPCRILPSTGLSHCPRCVQIWRYQGEDWPSFWQGHWGKSQVRQVWRCSYGNPEALQANVRRGFLRVPSTGPFRCQGHEANRRSRCDQKCEKGCCWQGRQGHQICCQNSQEVMVGVSPPDPHPESYHVKIILSWN